MKASTILLTILFLVTGINAEEDNSEPTDCPALKYGDHKWYATCRDKDLPEIEGSDGEDDSCEYFVRMGKCMEMSDDKIKEALCDNEDMQKVYKVGDNCCACGGGNNYLWAVIVFPILGVLCYGAIFYYMCLKKSEPAVVVVAEQPGS